MALRSALQKKKKKRQYYVKKKSSPVWNQPYFPRFLAATGFYCPPPTLHKVVYLSAPPPQLPVKPKKKKKMAEKHETHFPHGRTRLQLTDLIATASHTWLEKQLSRRALGPAFIFTLERAKHTKASRLFLCSLGFIPSPGGGHKRATEGKSLKTLRSRQPTPPTPFVHDENGLP